MSRPRSDLKRSDPLHQQVARNLRNDIEAGKLRDGEALPSTRELAKEWGVSPYTINEAMEVLIKEGIVEAKPRASRRVRFSATTTPLTPQVKTPQVILIGGFAGSGKTELGRVLARETSWAILDKDTLTRPVVEIALETLGQSPHDRESQEYLSKIRGREYEALNAAMLENIHCGNSAIVTAPFIKEFADDAWVSRVMAQCEEVSANLTLVWVYCDADTMHTYIRHRGAARDTGKLADWDGYLTGVDLELRPNFPHVVVDNSATSEPLQMQAKRLIQSLSEKEESS